MQAEAPSSAALRTSLIEESIVSLDTTGIPLPGYTPRGRELISSLQNKPYRFFLTSQLLSTIGMWIQRLALDWVLLEITGSVTLVGFLVVLQFGPTLILGMWGGVLVDRYSTRMLLLMSQSVVLAVNLALVVAALTGTLSAWVIFALSGVLGFFSIVDQPGRQVIIGQIVGPVHLGNAISMNQITYQIAGMAGPALAALLLIAPGQATVFVAASTAHLLALIAMILLFVKAQLIRVSPSPREPGQIAAAFAYAARKPEIRYTLIMLVFVCVLALNWPILFVSMATVDFDSGPGGYGLANTAIAAGSLVGGILALRRTHRGLRTVIIAMSGFCAFRAFCGLAPYEWMYLLIIAGTGVWSILMWTGANSLLQWSTNSRMRGRIMSLYLLIAVGGQALGGPLLGWACQTFGTRPVFVLSGLVPLVAIFIVISLLRRAPRT